MTTRSTGCAGCSRTLTLWWPTTRVRSPARDAAREGRVRRPAYRRATPESLPALLRAGVRVVTLANNHVLDHGSRGLADALAALDGVGIRYCGAGLDERDPRLPLAVEVNGEKLSFVAVMAPRKRDLEAGRYAARDRPGPRLLNPGAVTEDLARADGPRVVLAHSGEGHGPRPTPSAIRLRSCALPQPTS